MKRGIKNKKLQNTLEYIIILSMVIIVAISVSVLYMKNTNNVKLGNTDTLLAVAYFSGANGQYICNATEQENQCFEILLTQPLPKYPTYNLTYWNNEEQATNYNFELEQDNYMIWINSPFPNQMYSQWNNQFYYYPFFVGDYLDNFYDVNYIGQVNGYYEYIINPYGANFQQPAFASSLELQYYSPNLLTYYNGGSPSNTTYILPIDGKPIPIEMYLNATSLVNLIPEQPVQVPNVDSILSVTEVGLATGSSLSYNETFSNGTMISNSFSIPSNSENTFVISNLTNQLPENVTLSLTGITNGVTVGKETVTTSDNNNVFINFTPPAPIKLISTTSTVGPFVVTTNRNEQFSNMVVTTGNTLSSGSNVNVDGAYITNITGNTVEFFIKNPANVLYLNFEGTSQLSPNGPTGEPSINPNSNYGQYDDGAIVFNNYTNFAGPSSGTFGTENALDQNTIISTNVISGPFSFTANGNQTMGFTINDGLTISQLRNDPNSDNLENLYLPIKNRETYILGGSYNPCGGGPNIGISNSTYGYYAGNPMWTNGMFEREAVCSIYLQYIVNSNSNTNAGPTPDLSFYYKYPQILTYSIYSLNGNIATITFPDGQNKTFSEPLNGASYNFTIETSSTSGLFYYLAETNQPVQLETCNTYSAPNTITCS